MERERCLQVTSKMMTWCFKVEAGETVCSLSFCPAETALAEGLARSVWKALNGYCVMGEEYGKQGRFDEGLGEFMNAVVKKSRIK